MSTVFFELAYEHMYSREGINKCIELASSGWRLYSERTLNSPVVYITDRSKAVVPMCSNSV